MKRTLGLVLLFVAVSAAAQLPRPANPLFAAYQMTNYFGGANFVRVRTVCNGTSCDFPRLGTGTGLPATTHGALDWLATLPDGSSGHACNLTEDAWSGPAWKRPATQCRNYDNRWLIIVLPGQGGAGGIDPEDAYTPPLSETRIAVPGHVVVQGLWTGHAAPLGFLSPSGLLLTATSGCLVTVGDDTSIVNQELFWFGVPTGYIKGVCMEGGVGGIGGSVLTNVSLQLIANGAGANVCASGGRSAGLAAACAVDGFVIEAGGNYCYTCSGLVNGTTLGQIIRVTGGGSVSFYSGRWTCTSSATACIVNAGTSDLKLWQSFRIDPGAILDLKNESSGTIQAQAGIAYGPVSGTITNMSIAAPYGTTNPSTCSKGQIFVNTTGASEKICYCTAANTFKCSAGL